MMHMMMMGLMGKMALMGPLMMLMIKVKAIKALLLSKLALMMSLGQLMKGKKSGGSGECQFLSCAVFEGLRTFTSMCVCVCVCGPQAKK